MSQIILESIGDLAASVRLEDDPSLALGAGDLLVEMHAAPINPVDFLFAAGYYGVAPTLERPIGTEGVGRVIDAGTGADRSLIGRRVIVLATEEQGTWADRTVVPERNVVPVGEAGDAAQLAQLSINPVTAHVMLSEYGDLKPGSWVGQTLGNSAVGHYVVRLAKLAGYKTLSVVRSEQAAEQVRAAGGDLVVLAGEDLGARVAEALAGETFDLVLDGEGGTTVGELAQSLRSGGRVVAYSSITGAPQALGLGDLIFREIELSGWWLVNWLRNTPRDQILATYAYLETLLVKGEIGAPVEASYAISDYRNALEHAARPGRSGKIVFTFKGNE